MAADGTVSFVGRGSVCINTGGEKVYPEEVEEALKTHPAVVDCNVVGVPDDRFGEAVTAVVQLAPDDADVSDDELVGHVKQRLAGYKAPRHVVRVARAGPQPDRQERLPPRPGHRPRRPRPRRLTRAAFRREPGVVVPGSRERAHPGPG